MNYGFCLFSVQFPFARGTNGFAFVCLLFAFVLCVLLSLFFCFCFRAAGRFGARRRFFCLLIRCFINLYKRFSSSASSVTDFATPRPKNRRKELILSLVRPRVQVGGSTRNYTNTLLSTSKVRQILSKNKFVVTKNQRNEQKTS